MARIPSSDIVKIFSRYFPTKRGRVIYREGPPLATGKIRSGGAVYGPSHQSRSSNDLQISSILNMGSWLAIAQGTAKGSFSEHYGSLSMKPPWRKFTSVAFIQFDVVLIEKKKA